MMCFLVSCLPFPRADVAHAAIFLSMHACRFCFFFCDSHRPDHGISRKKCPASVTNRIPAVSMVFAELRRVRRVFFGGFRGVTNSISPHKGLVR